jgi:aryl-alcohol dehydrogenase-like predicted oxidoreductase
MRYRQFGNTELKVSEIGFGAWAIGGGAMIGETAIGWGKTDDNVSIKAINKALDTGINFFDTADIYGLGHSEELLGKNLKGNNEVIIATKVGNVSRNDQFTVDYSKEHIMHACEASLKRLKREAIDLYQLHTARLEHLEKKECIDAMELLKKQGKIRYWGLSLNTFEPDEEGQWMLENGYGSGFQLVLNLLNQKAMPLIKKASGKGYGIIARMPLQFGLLTGKFDEEFYFEKNDHRQKRITREIVTSTNKVLSTVWDFCEKYGCTKTQLALSYALSHDEISVVIPGIRTVQHVMDNTSGLFTIDEGDMKLIEGKGEELKVVMEMIRKHG